jgi:hypothetical protein
MKIRKLLDIALARHYIEIAKREERRPFSIGCHFRAIAKAKPMFKAHTLAKHARVLQGSDATW